ncbi:MAG: transposase, partial [Eubacterium sp.]
KHFGRKRTYPLHGFLSALILQKIFSIPSDALLLVFLSLSRELRDFCGFDKVPDASLLTRFKQDFCPFLEQMFEELVDLTEPICQAINASLSSMLTFDTSGIELYVTENNPKYFNSLLNQIKTTYKDKPKIKPLNIAYGLMPSAAAAATDAKQLYINGHFCYADKFAILTNGLGVVRHISFLDDSDFKAKHPDVHIRSLKPLIA